MGGGGAGCASYRFNVDAVSVQPAVAEAVAYVVVNGNPELDETDLRCIEAVDFLKTALAAKGMYPALGALLTRYRSDASRSKPSSRST